MSGLREHMFHNNIGFQFAHFEMHAGVLQCYVWMFLAMQRSRIVGSLSLPPIIQEEVMQQSASRGCLVIHAEHFGDRIGNERDPYDMVIDMVGMVEKILQFDKFIVSQDIVDQTDIFTPYRSWYQQRYYARPDHRVVQMKSNQKDQQCNHNEHQLGEFRIEKVTRGECIGKQEENKQTKRQCDQEPYLPMIPIAKDPCRMWYVQCLPPLWN